MIRQLTYKVQDNFNVSLFKKIKHRLYIMIDAS